MLGLLAAAGCNQIWGLGQVDLVDLPDSKTRIRLQLEIAKTTAEGSSDPNLEFRKLTPPPAIQLGLLNQPLMAASYDPDGWVDYPAEYAGKPWRLVYTLTDGVPREVHWSPPPGDVGHIVEPLFGRVDRMAVPADAGYEITPVSSPSQHPLTRVFTTGIWTEGVFSGTSSGATFNYNFTAKAVSLSGPLGAPEAAKADHTVLADFKNLNGCRATSGVATFAVPDLVPNTFTPPATQPTYYFADKQVRLSFSGGLIGGRLGTLLGSRLGPGSDFLRMEYGYVPSTGVFGFSKPVPAAVLDFYLPGPRMISFTNCAIPSGTMLYQSETFADSPDLTNLFPRVVHVEVVNQRFVGTLPLTSGFSAVLTSGDYNFTTDFAVAAPTAFRLVRSGAQIANLDTAADSQTLPPGTGPMELVFDVEPSPGLLTDYFDLTLYSIEGTNLNRQRVYTVTDRKLMIDPTFLLPGTEYVFEVRAYRGRPDITRANFAINTYPQYAATVFTRTFKMPP